MTVHNFPSDVGWTPVGTFSDAAPLNVGTVFFLSAAANVTGVRFYAHQAATFTARLYADGTQVAEETGVSAGAAAWTTATFDTPYSATTGVAYIAAVLQGSGTAYYTSRTNSFTDGTDPALVTVGPASSNTGNNGLYVYGTGVPNATIGSTGPWFGVDAVIDDLDTGDRTVNAPTATATATAHAPTVSGLSAGTVVAVRAQGSGAGQAPGVSGATVTSGGGPATGTGQALAPTVNATGDSVSVTAVRATGTGSAHAPGVNVVEMLPSNTGTGRITARFATAQVLVGDNDGIPNIYPVSTETVTFTSTASVLLNATAEPDAIVILPQPIVCTLDAQGYMVDSAGHRWCDLIATDDADLTPAGRKWTVSFSSGLGISSFPMNVPVGTTVDLTAVIPT